MRACAVDRLLDLAAALRDQERLSVVRLLDIDHLLRLETTARPMQSILRKTA